MEFFATGPGVGLIMYILTTLEFPTHYLDFHLYIYIYIYTFFFAQHEGLRLSNL